MFVLVFGILERLQKVRCQGGKRERECKFCSERSGRTLLLGTTDNIGHLTSLVSVVSLFSYIVFATSKWFA